MYPTFVIRVPRARGCLENSPDPAPPKKPDFERLRNAIRTARLLCDRYVQEYGSILCPAIQTKLFGRTYYLPDPDEFQKFLKAGGHSDPTKCMHIVGNASKWTMEILLDKGVVEL